MPMRPRNEHTLDVSQSPDGSFLIFLDGDQLDASQIHDLSIEYDTDRRKLVATITHKVIINKLSTAGIDVNFEDQP
jgi:hypothetical protein